MKEVAKHNSPDDCWVVIHGVVYDLTSFYRSHPGGSQIIVSNAVGRRVPNNIPAYFSVNWLIYRVIFTVVCFLLFLSFPFSPTKRSNPTEL